MPIGPETRQCEMTDREQRSRVCSSSRSTARIHVIIIIIVTTRGRVVRHSQHTSCRLYRYTVPGTPSRNDDRRSAHVRTADAGTIRSLHPLRHVQAPKSTRQPHLLRPYENLRCMSLPLPRSWKATSKSYQFLSNDRTFMGVFYLSNE